MNSLTTDDLTGINHEGFFPNSPLRYLSATSILSDKVFNAAGQDLGHIKDFMIDISTGAISYYIVEFGGFLGIGIKYFAIPFGKLTVDAEKKAFRFNVPKEALENAPGFDIDHWPDTNIHLEAVNSYWSFMGE